MKGKVPLEKRNQSNTNWKNPHWKRDSNEGRFNSRPSKAEVGPIIFQIARKLDLWLQCLDKGHRAFEVLSPHALQHKKEKLIRANENVGGIRAITLREFRAKVGKSYDALDKGTIPTNCQS